MGAFFLFAIVVIICCGLVMAGVPFWLLAVLGGIGFVWLLASAMNMPPPQPKEKSTPSGCPFLDKLP